MQTENSTAKAPSGKSHWLGNLLKYGVPLIITIGLCYLLFTGFDFREMMTIIRNECNYWWIALALFISIFSHVFRALRWRIQLKALNIPVPLWTLVLSIFGTYAVNLVFPRLGELWRTGYVAQRQHASFTEVFGSMVAERLADTVTVALLTAFTFLVAGTSLQRYLQQNPEAYEKIVALVTSPWLWGAIVVLVVAVVLMFRLRPQNKVIVKVKEFVAGLWKGFAVIASMPGKGWWLLWTVCLWGCYYLQLYVAFFAFPVTAQVVGQFGATAVLLCFVLSSISMAVPSNGGIGPWQWAVIFGLSVYAYAIPGLTTAYSATFANLVMASQTLLLIVLGIFTFICIAIDKRRIAPNTAPNTDRQ